MCATGAARISREPGPDRSTCATWSELAPFNPLLRGQPLSTTPLEHKGAGRGPNAAEPPEPPKRGIALRKLGLFLLMIIIAGAVAWRLGLFELRDRYALAATVEEVRSVR